MKVSILKLCFVLLALSSVTAYGVIIQENEPGFVGVFTGTVDDNNPGWTGTGFANTDNALGNYVEWEYEVLAAGTYDLQWRIANGSADNRWGSVQINGTEQTTIDLLPTGTWEDYALTDVVSVTFEEGVNTIQLVAGMGSGLANIDYIEIVPEPATLLLLGLGGLVIRKR